jgi:DnaJ-class molecular chaperone
VGEGLRDRVERLLREGRSEEVEALSGRTVEELAAVQVITMITGPECKGPLWVHADGLGECGRCRGRGLSFTERSHDAVTAVWGCDDAAKAGAVLVDSCDRCGGSSGA